MDATILPGLPPYGPTPELFPPGWGHGAHEGTVVCFRANTSPDRIVNFEPGPGSLTNVFPWIVPDSMLVLSKGAAYLVAGAAGEPILTLAPVVSGVTLLDQPRLIIFEEAWTRFLAFLPNGRMWRTRRLSWDGFNDVAISGDTLVGLADDPTDRSGRPKPFLVDLRTGKSSGGSYTGPDTTDGQLLAPDVAS
jgi:hypothetical protein